MNPVDDFHFHSGERAVQERTGERGRALVNSRNIRPRLPEAALAFIGQQRWCAIGATDTGGSVWAGLLAGQPGFLRASEDLSVLSLNPEDPHARLADIEPFRSLEADRSVALLLIEPQTRRRLKVNGRAVSAPTSEGRFDVGVGQALALCPRYIQKRVPDAEGKDGPDASDGTDAASTPASTLTGSEMESSLADWIHAADTSFIASLGPDGEADVSHRGGKPGFVQFRGRTLRIPDFNGNSMFNTLGNLTMDPRCGLVFPDFDGSRQLQLTGRAQVVFDIAEDAESTGGTGRWIEFHPESWRVAPFNLPLRWRFVEASPFNP